MTWRLVISQIFLRESFFAGVYFPPLKKALPYCCQKIEQNSNNFFFCPDIGGEFSFPEARRNKVFEALKTFQLLLEGIERIKQVKSLALIFWRFRIFANVFVKVSQKMQCSSRNVEKELARYFFKFFNRGTY